MSLDYYSYDALNRITGVWENKQSNTPGETSTGLTQQHVYDRFGNRRVNNAASNFPSIFNAPFNVDQTNDGYTGAGARTYDANNKLVSATVSGGGTVSYTYNANSSRISKTVGSTTTWYIYGLGGELVAEYPMYGAASTPQIEYGYRNGELLIEGGCDVMQWRVTDHLGSTRMSVGTTGSLASVKRTDYLPFGEQLGAGHGPRTAGQGYAADCWRQKFTGYEKDAETGLDYAQARMYANGQGRFTSVDPLWITAKRLVDPQRLNLYSYVRNNPLKYVDPDGMDIVLTAKDEEDAKKKFQIYLLGFKKEDRSHVQLVVGNGKNGFKKGQFGVTVDAKHKSDSENFQFTQKAANDHTAIGKINIVKEGETYQIREGTFKNGKESFKISTNKLGPLDQEFDGYTFFEYRGKREEGIIYARGVSEIVVHGGQDDVGLSSAVHHELRHLVLGDFGRTAPKAKHALPGQPKTEADIETEKADKEAIGNAKKP